MPQAPQALQVPQAPHRPQAPAAGAAGTAGAAWLLKGSSWPERSEGHERSPAGVYIYLFDRPEGKATVTCVCVYVCMCVCVCVCVCMCVCVCPPLTSVFLARIFIVSSSCPNRVPASKSGTEAGIISGSRGRLSVTGN